MYTFHAFGVYIRFNKVKVVNFTISAMIVAYTDQLALFILLLTTISEYILTKDISLYTRNLSVPFQGANIRPYS